MILQLRYIAPLLAVFLCAPTFALLQRDKAPSQAKSQTAIFAEFEKGTHTGPAESALVSIWVTGTNPNGSPITPRYGNGLVLRCDGFIAVPFDLFNLTSDSTPSAPSKLSVRITINPGTEREQQLTMPRLSRYFIDNKRRLGFTVFKLEGPVHVPAARTLLPDNLKAGDQIQIVWRETDPSGKGGQFVHKTARLASLPQGLAGEGVVEDTSEHPGRVRLAESVGAVPPGAVVVGPEGLVIGIIPGARESDRDSFISMAALNNVTNCIGPVPSTDSEFRVNNPAPPDIKEGETKATGKMVKVPGGPVVMPPLVLRMQPDMELQQIACVAPFEIDRLEVTNGEYLAFWNTFSEKQRADAVLRKRLFPLAWAPVGEPFPGGIANLPVLGVSPAGAMAYARSKGKRLPTPYEWVKAALGPYGENSTPEWVTRFNADLGKTWERLVALHSEYIRTNVGLQEFARHPVNEKGGEMQPFLDLLMHIPWWNLPREQWREMRFSFNASSQLADEMNAIWRSPTSVIGVGQRPYDVSPYGAEDMLLNAHEQYLSNPQTPVFGELRYILFTTTSFANGQYQSGSKFIPFGTRNERWVGLGFTSIQIVAPLQTTTTARYQV